MKAGFYPKLAWNGIHKNHRMYFPYLLTCIGMVMMYYIIAFLSRSESLRTMKGGDTMQMVLRFGCGVIAVFAVIFLFYTNSFLIRRRKKEYGLYNILGMGKWNLTRIQIWESLITAVIALFGGLVCGILFSKLADLCMQNIMKDSASLSFSISLDAVLSTIILFVAIFALIFISSVIQIHVANPIALLHSENTGEKRPKGNWLLAILGVVLLAVAYYLAVSIEEPMSAMTWFFIAVLMVIAGTYFLFIAGSVVLCRLLQKNRRYYYKTKHFVSVSSMAYRMKRNGASLAAICILSTMVLVMLSSTICLYTGAEDSLRQNYPSDIMVTAAVSDEDVIADVEKEVNAILDTHGQTAKNILEYDALDLVCYCSGDQMIMDPSSMDNFDMSVYDKLRYLIFVPISDYNRLMGTNEQLKPGEVIVYAVNDFYDQDTLNIDVYGELKVKKQADHFMDDRAAMISIVSTLFVFTPDYDKLNETLSSHLDSSGNSLTTSLHHYGFDLNCSDEKESAIYTDIKKALQGADSAFDDISIRTESIAQARIDYYSLYGGLLFLGVILGLVFLAATVLMMYYKQISEGYEDQMRFTIMQKVGMTKKEIRQSINSQILTVFFLPLVMAGIHLAFAFPLIAKILALFASQNTRLLTVVTIICYLVFALFYMIVYRITSRSYYQIVSTGSEE